MKDLQEYISQEQMLIYLLTKQAWSLDLFTEKLLPSESLQKAKFLPITMEFFQFI